MDKKKIMVVDDEMYLANMIRMRLEANDYEVEIAKDGKEALEKIRKGKPPDLVILDLMMPKLDGYQVCRMMKFDVKYKHIPIIMLTARTQEKDKSMGLEVGADAYLTKPFDPQQLLEKVAELLQASK